MSSIPRLSRILRQLLFHDAIELARAHGVIQRVRVFTGASLLHVLVFGWLQVPQPALREGWV